MKMCADKFGGIDVLINNASAIWPRGTADTPMKRYDLMNDMYVYLIAYMNSQAGSDSFCLLSILILVVEA